jgi:hypothetical protein
LVFVADTAGVHRLNRAASGSDLTK